MHPAEIKAELEKAGFTQADIADPCSVSREMVGRVISGGSRSRLVEAAIAAAIGKKPRDLWPDGYDRQGRPVRKKRSPMPEAARRVAAAVSGAR